MTAPFPCSVAKFCSSTAIAPPAALRTLNPLPGYTQADCDPPGEDGFDQLVTWGDKDVKASSERIRFEDVRLYAICLIEVK